MKKQQINKPTLSSPVDTEEEMKDRYRNPLSPVDTPEELDSQINNLGPKDTTAEIGSEKNIEEEDKSNNLFSPK